MSETKVKVPAVMTAPVQLSGADVESIVNEWIEARGWSLASRPQITLAVGVDRAARDQRYIATSIDHVDLVIKAAPLPKPPPYQCPGCGSTQIDVHSAECAE